MKNISDIFSCLQRTINKVGNRIAITALFMVAAITMANGQEDFTFIEGSVHGFKVENHDGNTFTWSMHDVAFNALDPLAFTFIEGQFDTDVKLRFNDIGRVSDELVHLAVTETNGHGCSTTRALRIKLMPNNMYLDFAMLPSTADCFSSSNYTAGIEVGMNFKDRHGLTDSAIPADRFPLKVSYQIKNLTAMTDSVIGNGGLPLVIDFSATNEYTLLVTEAIGTIAQTTEYELKITSVRDKFDTEITHDENRRMQIRIINHLPQTGGMDMAMAYVLTPINYMGSY